LIIISSLFFFSIFIGASGLYLSASGIPILQCIRVGVSGAQKLFTEGIPHNKTLDHSEFS